MLRERQSLTTGNPSSVLDSPMPYAQSRRAAVPLHPQGNGVSRRLPIKKAQASVLELLQILIS
ncbi:MAG: hypothetical protein RMX99_023220 [Aulosira sp. DedVER01a]|nr:hypothetical protein [Aulosira sp. ZfuVER01]